MKKRHTGYNLDSPGDQAFDRATRIGFDCFKKTFFGPDGAPAYCHDLPGPIDVQCASQAIETLAFFSKADPESLTLSQKLRKLDTQQHAGFGRTLLLP